MDQLARGTCGRVLCTLKVSYNRNLADVACLLRCPCLRSLVALECPHWAALPDLVKRGVEVVHGQVPSVRGVAGALGDDV